MSLLSWFHRKALSKPDSPPMATVARVAARVPGLGGQLPVRSEGARLEPAAVLKVERTERREWVYSVVREAMLHAGVLSASYKFKVLALDERGRRFLVMVDLARGLAGDTVQLLRVESQITQTAKARYDLEINAVYWRTNDQIAAERPRSAAAAQGVAVAAPAVPLAAPPARQPVPARAPALASPAAPSNPASGPLPLRRTAATTAARFEPIQADEVAAFKRALSAATQTPTPPPGDVLRSGPRAKAAKGYEDTEMIEPLDRPDALSNTQYGDLK